MIAIYQRELKAYFDSVTGWLCIAFLCAAAGLYFMVYNLFYGYPNIISLICSIMNHFMTVFTQCKSFPSSCYHKLFPVCFSRKVSEFVHMMHLNCSFCSAHFTFSCF